MHYYIESDCVQYRIEGDYMDYCIEGDYMDYCIEGDYMPYCMCCRVTTCSVHLYVRTYVLVYSLRPSR